jgi:hypothetical protein
MATIQSYVEPSRLYRYRSLRAFDREMEAIEDGYLFCAAYRTLNDPMEGLFSSSKLLRESEDYRTIRDSIRDNKSQIGMCSFSEVHDHELMWAHYVDQFRGICIAYNFSKLRDGLADDITFARMFYNESVPTIRLSDEEPGEIAKMVLSYKNHRWLYEREWRMFASLGKAFYRPTNCVTRVYLGSRIEDDDQIRIKSRLKRLKIKTSDMTIDKYSISFETRSRT